MYVIYIYTYVHSHTSSCLPGLGPNTHILIDGRMFWPDARTKLDKAAANVMKLVH